MKVRALSARIFKDRGLGSCSNGGISERYNEVLVQCDDGNIEIDLDNPPENFCIISEIMGHKYVRPYAKPTQIGWMAGGTIVYTCDSRFRHMSEYPLSLHDRQETQAEYDMLSK